MATDHSRPLFDLYAMGKIYTFVYLFIFIYIPPCSLGLKADYKYDRTSHSTRKVMGKYNI